MQLNHTPIANPMVVLREEFDDWAVLFNPDTTEAVGINPMGIAIWKRIDGARTLAQLIEDVRESFSDVPDTVATEVNAFVDDLAQRGFIGLDVRETV